MDNPSSIREATPRHLQLKSTDDLITFLTTLKSVVSEQGNATQEQLAELQIACRSVVYHARHTCDMCGECEECHLTESGCYWNTIGDFLDYTRAEHSTNIESYNTILANPEITMLTRYILNPEKKSSSESSSEPISIVEATPRHLLFRTIPDLIDYLSDVKFLLTSQPLTNKILADVYMAVRSAVAIHKFPCGMCGDCKTCHRTCMQSPWTSYESLIDRKQSFTISVIMANAKFSGDVDVLELTKSIVNTPIDVD